jgi:hypothetical protein
MQINNKEMATLEAAADAAPIIELEAVHLACVGGGIAELVGA